MSLDLDRVADAVAQLRLRVPSDPRRRGPVPLAGYFAETGLDHVGGALVANAGTVLVAVATAIMKLVGGDVDHRRRVHGSADLSMPAPHLEEVLEVRFVVEKERDVDRAGVVVGDLDTLDQILLDELSPAQVKPQLEIVERASRLFDEVVGLIKQSFEPVTMREHARVLLDGGRLKTTTLG